MVSESPKRKRRVARPKKNESRAAFLNRAADASKDVHHIVVGKRALDAKKWRLANEFRFEMKNDSGFQPQTIFPFTMNCDDDSDCMKMFITNDIRDPWEMTNFVEMLRNHNDKDVDVEINSRGGSVDLAMGMFNAMAEHGGTVTARITGTAASAGLLVSQAADVVKINENATIMMHPGAIVALMVVNGLTKDAQNQLDFYQEMTDKGTAQIIDLLAMRSGQMRDKVEEMVMAKGGMGTTLDAKEAVEMGFADEIIAMVPRGEQQGGIDEPATQNAAFNVYKELELANAQYEQFQMSMAEEVSSMSI